MSPLQILKLVGFATGAALYLTIVRLILKRRLGSRESLTQVERCFVMLGLCLGVWFSGNLLSALHELLLGTSRLSGLARAWDLITMAGVSLVPAALLHLHVAFWSSMDNHRSLKPRHVRIAGLIIYLPILAFPFAAYLILRGDYQPFFVKLRRLLVPYSVWYLSAFWSSAVIDWVMKDRFYKFATRERKFFKRLAVLLFFTGAFEFVVVAIRRSGPNDALWVLFILFSLLPTFAAAYHVYRYKLVELVIKDTLVYSAFATVFIAVYIYGVRYIDQWLVDRYQVRPGVIEVILILGMVALARPLVRVMDQAVHRLFAREIGLYRDVVRQVTTGAAGFGELDSLIRYTENVIRQGLDLIAVRVAPVNREMPDGPERRLAEKLTRWRLEVIEADEELAAMEATAAYALRREDRMIGLLIITADPHTLTSEKRAILDVLAGQVAVELESCSLIEEKLRLERELANRERLATLGQMAATVAHEVKNPLSAIKSIAQVMREEEALSGYDRDLTMIVSEIDRLNRTVSQLLAFSRPSSADTRPTELREMVEGIVALFRGEARDRGVEVRCEISSEVTLDGGQSAAVREALSNLVLNAIQATDRGGEVSVEAGLREQPAGARQREGMLVLTVTDTGPGISEEAQHRVFEPFYTTKSRGTGLGLAIVQRRVMELGGTVELVSPVSNGHGTRFRLLVPGGGGFENTGN